MPKFLIRANPSNPTDKMIGVNTIRLASRTARIAIRCALISQNAEVLFDTAESLLAGVRSHNENNGAIFRSKSDRENIADHLSKAREYFMALGLTKKTRHWKDEVPEVLRKFMA